MPLQIAVWYVHKDLCNKTVKSRLLSPLMPLSLPPAQGVIVWELDCWAKPRAVTSGLRILDKTRLGLRFSKKSVTIKRLQRWKDSWEMAHQRKKI